MQENFSKDEDLDLLAFRYIAGELTPAESEAFEQRLADDQAAREAVARAVDLAQAVASVPADIVPLSTTHHSPLTTHHSHCCRAPPTATGPLDCRRRGDRSRCAGNSIL